MKTRKAPLARGALIEKAYIMAWIVRQLDRGTPPDWTDDYDNGFQDTLLKLKRWLRAQPARTRRPGGIGRR